MSYLPVARVLDSTFGSGSHGLKCCGHTFSGKHIVGSFTVWVEDRPVTRLTDIGVHFCPHCPVNMNVGSTMTTFYEDLPSHCLTHPVTEFCGMGASVQSNFTVYDGE